MSDNLLKPCPFCGRVPGLYLERHNMWTVRCHKCGVTMCCATSEIAIRTWNKREGVESNDQD